MQNNAELQAQYVQVTPINWEVQTDTKKVAHTTFSTFIIAGKKELITVDLTVYFFKKLIYQNKGRRMKVLALKLLFTTFIPL